MFRAEQTHSNQSARKEGPFGFVFSIQPSLHTLALLKSKIYMKIERSKKIVIEMMQKLVINANARLRSSLTPNTKPNGSVKLEFGFVFGA